MKPPDDVDRVAANLDTIRGLAKPAAHVVDRIVSDGQSGAARGALEAAIALGLNHGGWCSQNRVADDGPLDPKYGLRKRFGGFGERVAANIQHSDGTLLMSFCAEAELDARTAHARNHAKLKRKALLHLQMPSDVHALQRHTIQALRAWFHRCHVRTLHVIGPLEKTAPGIGEAVEDLLMIVLSPDEPEQST